MEEIDRIKESVELANPVNDAIKKIVDEQVSERSGNVYRLFSKVIATHNEIKKLKRSLEEAEKSLEKSQAVLERAKKGDFSWIQDKSKQNLEQGEQCG